MTQRTIILALLFGWVAAAQPSGPRWWQREPLRLVDLVTGMDGINFRPAPEVAARKGELRFNSEHLDIMGFVPGGMDDSLFFFRSPLASRQNEDYLGAYLPEAKKHGMRVMIYLNVHWFTYQFGRKHPEWVQIKEDGKPLDKLYDTGTSFCMNSGWRDWTLQIVKDLCKYPIDGIFYDGPVFFNETCYCGACRTKFRRMYGKEMPSKRSIRGRDFHELVDFQARSLSDFLRDTRAIMKAASPDLALYMNGGARGSNWATGRLNRILVEHQDILGSEGGFIYGDLTRTPLWKPGLTARLLESQAPDKPRVIFSAAAHKPWTYSLLPPPELRLLYADTVANGAGTWFCFTPKELKQPELDALAAMNGFMARNGRYYMDTRSEAKVALVWSDTTANAYSGSDAQLIDIDTVAARSAVGNLNGEFLGLADALMRSHTPFDVVDDVTLEGEPLGRYDAIFLPNVACMSDKTAAALGEYVRAGGHLFATFETSLYDEYGMRRTDFALADVLGVKSLNHIAGPRRWDFMEPRGRSPLLKGLETREMLPSPEWHVQVRNAGAEEAARFFKTMTGRYDGLPTPGEDPALTVNRFGKGTAVYAAGDLGNALNSYHVAEMQQLVANAAAELAPSPVRLENAPGSVELVVRSQQKGKRLLLHLVNFTGEMTRPITRIQPQRDVTIVLPEGIQAARVHTLMNPGTLPVRNGRIVVPRVDEYEVVVVER